MIANDLGMHRVSYDEPYDEPETAKGSSLTVSRLLGPVYRRTFAVIPLLRIEALMNRIAITIIALAFLHSSATGADTFASQIRMSKHVGLFVDKELSAFTLYQYTSKQYSEHVASFEQFKRDRDAYKERMSAYERERREAKSVEERNAITMKRNRENSNMPTSRFDRQIKLHKVAAAGDDFITLIPLGEPSRKVTVPISRVGRLVVTQTVPNAGESAPAQ